jgi:translocation and assembly module TamB
VRAIAPGHGLLPALIGLKRPIDLTIDGDGSWTRWRGTARSTVGPADGAAGARRRQRPLPAVGQWLAGAVPQGQAAAADRAGGQGRGDATLKDRILDGQLTWPRRRCARSPRARSTSPTTAIARSAVGVDLLRPPALFPNMTGRNVRMVWTLDGPFATADYSYRLTSPA